MFKRFFGLHGLISKGSKFLSVSLSVSVCGTAQYPSKNSKLDLGGEAGLNE